jgi:MFS family permease
MAGIGLKSIRDLELHRNRPLQLIYATSMMMIMGTALLYPVLPIIVQSLEVSPLRIGLVMSAFSLPAVFLAPVGGVMADLRGRKVVLVTCLLLYGAAGLAVGLVDSFGWLLALRAVQGVGYSGIMPLAIVLIGDSFSGQREVTAQGMKVFFDRAGNLLFPLAGGFLGVIAWQAPFFAYGVAIPLALGVWRWLPEPEVTRGGQSRVYFRGVLTLALMPRTLTIFSMSSLRFFLEVAFFTYLPIFALQSLDISVQKGGLLFTVFALGAMVTSSQIGTLAGRHDKTRMVLVAFLLQGLCLLAASVATSLWWFLGIMLLFGVANGVISPTQKSLLTQSAPRELRGGVVAGDRITQNLAKTVAPPIAGLILTASSIPTMFRVLGVIALAWVALVLVLQIRGVLRPAAQG